MPWLSFTHITRNAESERGNFVWDSASRPSSQAAKIDQSAEEDGIWPQIANFLKTWRSHFEDDLCLERLRFGDAGGSWRPLSSRLSGLEGLTTTVYTILKSNVLP